MNIEQNKKIIITGKHLLASWGKKKEKTRRREKRKEKKFVRLQPPRLELSPFTLSQLSNTVYQRIELT